MNPVAAKQVALDNALVPLEKRLKIEKCNARIKFSKPQREKTYQVTLDALIISPCYPAFLITTKVPEIKCISLGEHLLLSLIGASLGRQHDLIDSENQELRSCGQHGAMIPDEMINQDIKDSNAYKTYLDFATGKATPKKARKFKKFALPSRKLSPILEEEPAVKPKRAKKPAKKPTTVPAASVVIKDTPSDLVPKKKTPAKVERGKGMDLLSDVALLEDAQLKKTLKKITLETHKLHANGSGDGAGSLPKVPDEQEDKTTDSGDDDDNDDDSDEVTKDDDDDDDVDSDADDDKEASDSEKTDFNEDENPNLNLKDDEEEKYEEEYVRTPDSFDFTKDDEEYEELYKDVNTTYEEVKDDDDVILTTIHDTQKTAVPLQSSSVSSDIANQFLNLDNVPRTDIEVISMMNVKVIPETSTTTGSIIPSTIPQIAPLPQQTAPTSTPAPTTATTISSIHALLDFSTNIEELMFFIDISNTRTIVNTNPNPVLRTNYEILMEVIGKSKELEDIMWRAKLELLSLYKESISSLFILSFPEID
ncbi:hypothetical protein Tco_0972037 [Tanacetum coccineum]